MATANILKANLQDKPNSPNLPRCRRQNGQLNLALDLSYYQLLNSTQMDSQIQTIWPLVKLPRIGSTLVLNARAIFFLQ